MGLAPLWRNRVVAETARASAGAIPADADTLAVSIHGDSVRIELEMVVPSDEATASIRGIGAALSARLDPGVRVIAGVVSGRTTPPGRDAATIYRRHVDRYPSDGQRWPAGTVEAITTNDPDSRNWCDYLVALSTEALCGLVPPGAAAVGVVCGVDAVELVFALTEPNDLDEDDIYDIADGLDDQLSPGVAVTVRREKASTARDLGDAIFATAAFAASRGLTTT
ncbi:hypothetical protein [Schumannella sp. 10F1B-5-1]|uniref:hypothetical protein n=1 Tax=Schumannella sp. 10F1B-5-1 TaxID=2590780 RepID=UPI001130DC0E|nr:hypothetical protein [Schumannella sp. 10F1B-5-1]TPW70941.1 hypothetical protein FJ658_12630 [Schumannella sp. 10F1B-5-1]